MDLREHAKYGLMRTRWLTNTVMESLQSEDDWFYQIGPKSNHAIWICGHLGLADNMFLSRFFEDRATKPDGWDELFWYGSALKERSAYPPLDEVRSYFKDRHEALVGAIDEITDEQLAAPAPSPEERSPIAGAPNFGHLLLFSSRHESVHFGQLTMIHRALGYDPIIS